MSVYLVLSALASALIVFVTYFLVCGPLRVHQKKEFRIIIIGATVITFALHLISPHLLPFMAWMLVVDFFAALIGALFYRRIFR